MAYKVMAYEVNIFFNDDITKISGVKLHHAY